MFIKILLQCLSVFLLLCYAVSETFAESPEFFEKNFAESPLKEGIQKEPTIPTPLSQKPDITIANTPTVIAEKEEIVLAEDKGSQFADGIGDPVIGLSLIVSLKPEPHAKKAIEQLMEVLNKFPSIIPDQILLIGEASNDVVAEVLKSFNSEGDQEHFKKLVRMLPRGATKQQLNEAIKRGVKSDPAVSRALKLAGSFSVSPVFPDKEQYRFSPVWKIRTHQGVSLLEGFLSPKQFMNENGQFVKPQVH